MDMLTEIKNDKFHWEFQLKEGSLMSIRVYEYGVKEMLRSARSNIEDVDEYELYLEMPEQVVVFLSGVNKKDRIKVMLRLPDRQEVTYTLPYLSAAVSVGRLIEDKLYLFIPYQQVQLNDRMTKIKDRSLKTKKRIAREIRDYHIQVKAALENLKNDGTITEMEHNVLTETFADIEKYLRKKDSEVDKEVNDMGDENYVTWSESIRAECAKENEQKLAEKEQKLAEKDKQLAEKDERIHELERQLAALKS
jgi:hypothetical protein